MQERYIQTRSTSTFQRVSIVVTMNVQFTNTPFRIVIVVWVALLEISLHVGDAPPGGLSLCLLFSNCPLSLFESASSRRCNGLSTLEYCQTHRDAFEYAALYSCDGKYHGPRNRLFF